MLLKHRTKPILQKLVYTHILKTFTLKARNKLFGPTSKGKIGKRYFGKTGLAPDNVGRLNLCIL